MCFISGTKSDYTNQHSYSKFYLSETKQTITKALTWACRGKRPMLFIWHSHPVAKFEITMKQFFLPQQREAVANVLCGGGEHLPFAMPKTWLKIRGKRGKKERKNCHGLHLTIFCLGQPGKASSKITNFWTEFLLHNFCWFILSWLG